MKLVVELLFFLAIVKYVAAETISFETRLIEAEESDYNEVSLTVKREGGTNGSIDYFCEVLNSTEDFITPTVTQTFPPHQTTSQCSLFIEDDTEPEGDEIYAVQLSLLSGKNVTIGENIAYIKITANDDGNGVVGFDVPNGVSVQEPRMMGGAKEKLKLKRNVGSFGKIIVHWRVTTAVAHNDITPLNGSVQFKPGEIVKNLEFSVRPDLLLEKDEDFEFELINVTGGARLNTSFTKVLVRILANDIPVRFASSHILVSENQTNVAVEIYRGLDASGNIQEASVDRTSSLVWYLRSDGALGNQDFHQTNGTVVFNTGETRKMISVTIIDDTKPEKSENFTVHLTNLSADISLVPPSVCTIQILHSDDHAGVFGLSGDGNLTISEDDSSNVVQITVNRTAGAFGMVNVSWMVASSQGEPSNQISPLYGAVVFGDGERQKLINITVKDDKVPEEAFWFIVELTSTSDGRITNSPSERSKKVIIRDSDDVYGVFEFSNDTYQTLSLTSQPRMVNFVISRTGGDFGTVSVDYIVTYYGVDGTNYTASIGIQNTGKVSFSSGQNNVSVSLSISSDGFIRANSVFRISLTSLNLLQPVKTLLPSTTPRFGFRTTVNLTVHPQYADGEIGFAKTSLTVTEPENGQPKKINLVVLRDGTFSRATLLWSIVGIKTSNDLKPTSGNLVFDKGDSSVNITIQVLADDTPELDESFTIRLHNVSESNQRLQAASSELVLTIERNDNPGGLFQFSNVGPKFLMEGVNNRLTVTVERLEGALDERYVVISVLKKGTNNEGNDFVAEKTVLIFKKGVRSMTKDFHVVDDDIPETNETFTVRLSSSGPANKEGALGHPTEFNVTILENDDANGIIVFANTSLSVAESKDEKVAARFVLERQRGLFGEVSVTWNVTSAVEASLDISPTSGKVEFAEHEKFKTFEIFSLRDEIPELNENFTVTLTQTDGGVKVGNPNRAQLIIIRNDDAIEFADPIHVRVNEGQSATFTILRRGRTNEAIHVNVTTKDGSARSGEADYVPITQQVSFARGESRKSITVNIPDDDLPEPDENFTVVLTSSTGDTSIYGNTVGIVTIAASDDPNGIFHFDGDSDLNKTASEGGLVSFRVVRDRGVFGRVGVLWQIYQVFPNGSRHALTSRDFDETSGELLFEDRNSSKDLVLRVSSDDLAEYGENFEVVLENVTGGFPGHGGELYHNWTVAFIHIPTNDNPYGLFAFAQNSLDVSVAEDTEPERKYEATANLTVVRKRGKDRDVGVSWCIYKEGNVTNLLEVWDLIFLSKSFGAIVVNDPQMKRANTGSNALEFIAINGSYAIVKSMSSVLSKEFTISAWLRPKAGHNGTILAKVLNSGETVYRLLIDTSTNVTLTLELMVTGSKTITASKEIGRTVLDDKWHNIMVAVGNESGVSFYYETKHIGTDSSVKFTEIRDGEGDLYLGATKPNVDQYEGFLQDVKIFTKTLPESEVNIIADPVKDITPINGYLDYPEDFASQTVALTTVDNEKTEDEKVYYVVLVSSRGGADIDNPSNSRARLTVLKSDYANGLFEFDTGQALSKIVSETVGNVTFRIKRTVGFSGEVSVGWAIFYENGSRASGDFIQSSGSLVFADGQNQNTLVISVANDQKPELQERFQVRLVSAQSNDGKKQSTARSGASINDQSSLANITISENDSPYGLLQFSSEPPRNGSISPLSDVFRINVRESIGKFQLYIERAQGTLGTIECSWKTVPVTAKANVDYVATGGSISLAEGQLSTSVDISIIDNSKPELNKTFRVELYGAKEGAEIGAGGVVMIVIEPSDDAFGIVNFTSSSLARSIKEGETFYLELQRSGGTLGDIMIGWEIENASGELSPSHGEVLLRVGQRTATFQVVARNDSVPEFSENYLVRLINVTSGRLSSRGIVSNITILANDDPYGVFEFDPTVVTVNEVNGNVTVYIVRRQGAVGKTRVYYTSVPRNVSMTDFMYNRAQANEDFRAMKGFVEFLPNQTLGSFVVEVLDDNIPEDNETIVFNLTSVMLVEGQGFLSVVRSPRIGTKRFAQVVILRNDNASGIVSLSSPDISVQEGTREGFLNVVRSGGLFGEVTVDIEVTSGSATVSDYHINASKVTLSDGQQTAVVPISITNDDEPEFAETFVVRLESSDGDVLVGSPSQCVVTIEENDYPHGLIGFSVSSLNNVVNEPSSGNQVVKLDVIREYGTRNIVKFKWLVTLSGKPATHDVQQTQGSGIIFAEENKTSFDIVILADNVPEVNEVLSVTLNITEGKAQLNPARSRANVTIVLNDEAHGVVEFIADSFTVHENDHNITARIPIVRRRGTHGILKVYYSTVQDFSLGSAIPNQDYIPVVNASVLIADGSKTSSVDVVILGDTRPEFKKYFTVALEYVELLQTGGSSGPRLGLQTNVNVTIEDDDYVYGLFKVFGERNQSLIVVNETEGLAVSLEVRRLGGATGDVKVTVIISPESTARENEDFKGSDATLDFKSGDRRKFLTLIINSDNIPERDETIIIKLINPTSGASVSQGIGNNVTVMIQANDVAAGYVGFTMLSQAVVVKEGEVVNLEVIRTSPAAGIVTVDWFIQGENVKKDFNETSGTVIFKEGQNSTYIQTKVLADNTSEIDEQFQIILRNPITSGISQTGAAEINNRMGTATVTIGASNEPHGVFEFQQSSRRVTVQESDNIVGLSVARLFGNIGMVRLYFTIINGSLHTLSPDEMLAELSTDVAVNTSSTLINNGASVGEIPLDIINDNLAELDEYFVVNITRVELVNSSSSLIYNETLTPPRLGRYLTSEVKIEKNDGPQGILVFDPARVNVPENITSFNLTVLRTQGTYGDVEVNYYIRRITIDENDFSVYDNLEKGGAGTLKFAVGQRRQNITVFINDDKIPEADEKFEVHLTQPRGGVLLTKDSFATVTVLVNDAGNGIFRFSKDSLSMTVDEPGSRHVGTTQASFTVIRENGTIGEVVVTWRIANITTDFKAVNGSVLFKDGERRKSFIVETIVDTVPEKKERFLIVLSIGRGGGDLKNPSQAWLTVSENDEPYGEFNFAVAPQTFNVEETIGYTRITVLRRKGTYGTVKVNYQTISQTADSSEGSVLKFGVFQSFRAQNAKAWYVFSAYGKQYLLLGADSHGNDDAYSGSGLFYWQGVYTHLTNITTDNPVQFESFEISGQYYVAVASHGSEGNYEVKSTIYQLFENGTVLHYQDISTQAASDVKFFRPQGSNDSYLIFANMKDNSGSTNILSKVYKWSNGRFVEHGLGLNCRGASGLALLSVSNREFLAISSYYDSVNADYQSKSVIFEWKNNRFEALPEISTNGATGVEYFQLDGDHFLLFVNSRSFPVLYKWNAGSFVFSRNVPIANAKSVKEFSMNGEAFLVSTSNNSGSQLWKWDSRTSNFQFYANLTEHSIEHVQPITIQDSVNRNLTGLATSMVASSETRLLQPTMVSAQADFIPRKGQLIFNNGDTELSIYVTIINDSISEPDETFMVALSNATSGSVIGPNGNLEVNILSNGNPYGRIEFGMGSWYKVVEERSRDWVLYLEVLREQGNYGEVIVAWNSTGNTSYSGFHDDSDVYPFYGEVVFMEGDTKKTINLTIVADDVPEINEVLEVSLTSLIKNGSNVPGQGATINTARSTSTVILRANDDPHGVLGWQRTVVLAQESEATNSTVQLSIERQLGTIGDIKVSYSTFRATTNGSVNEKPAVPNEDFIPVSSEVLLQDGVNMTNISVHVIHDNNAEINEVFYVNITAVQLLNSYIPPPENSPRIKRSSQIAKVIISENDNRRGELNFNVSHLVNPRTGIVRVNEDIGELRVHVLRSGGRYGTVGFEYRLVPYTVNDNDYSPVKGELIFQPNETSRVLVINITDDNIAEIAERFRLEMTQPIGGAKLGTNREVTVEIRASDQPYGVFEFSSAQTVLLEEGREVRLTVVRLQGSFREVRVSWNISAGAFPDIYPANGTLTFDNNVTSQVIRIRARNDDIPDGDKAYECYLVSADNGGVIGSERKVIIRIDANDDGYGVIAVDEATSLVYVGEPDSQDYNGEIVVSVIRNAGTYGEVPVDWELTSDDGTFGKVAETFNVTKGKIVFNDGVRMRNITLKVKQDPYPEETANYTLRLVKTRDARIDVSRSKASVVVVSSDHPYGIVEFDGDTSYNISEDFGHVSLSIVRNKGNTGKLLITINVFSSGATENVDFEVRPKVLTIDDQKDSGSINVSILAEDLPELAESFTVSLGNIQLVSSRYINYGYVNGLQVDMPPEVGPKSRVMFTILKNDDPHGLVQFRQSRLVVHEHDRKAVVTVLRTGGSFGVIKAQYTVTNITAEYGKDYIFSDGEITFGNGQRVSNLTIPLLDDKIPEDRESFRLDLTSVSGGGRLGDPRRLEIVLETSDNPNGLFGFVNQTRIVMENPAASRNLELGVARIGGARSFVRVSIGVFMIFPSPGLVTEDFNPSMRQLTFEVGDFGPKICKFTVFPFLKDREVEEHFQISITEVSGNASIDSLTENVTVVILKHGMPNGLFGFTRSSTQVVSEDTTEPILLTVDRKEGDEGTVELKWSLSDADGVDFVNNEGTITFLPSERSKQIRLRVRNDNIPELSENFVVTLVSANGGGDIDPSSRNATITIRANDYPHGRFRIASNTQRITVENDLSRVLRFTIQRTDGRFGDVRVNYRLVYSRKYLGSLNGYVDIRNGESDKTQSIVLDENTFLYSSSYFTLTLSSVVYRGTGVSEILPSLLSSASTESIPVPDRAANSLVKFKDGYTTLTVNKDNQVSRVVVTRDGLYGNVTVSILNGYPDDMYAGFTKGKVEPSVSSLSFYGNVRELEFSAQVTPVLEPKEKMVYAVYLSGVTTPRNVRGGAKIDESAQTGIVEPGGVIVVATETQNIMVMENDTAVLLVYRLYSTLGTVQLGYSTRRTSTAVPNQDYTDTSSTINMVDGEYRKEIRISIINDNLPELDETFSVQLTSVTGANARLGPNKTSTITIHDEDSPHGVLSFATRSLTVQENATVVNIIVSRTGGTFGDVGVLVRTIGGGESWTSGAREDIRDLLRSRVPSSIADSGDDYYTLNSRLTFNNQVPTPSRGQNKTVQLRIINDIIPEVDEEIYIYLSQLTGGAVLGNPSNGGQSWTVVKIAGNDLLNGEISFATSSLTLDEDRQPTGEIEVKRTNSLGVAKVKWEVLNSVENLEETSGTITFPAGETTAILRLKLEPDNNPELKSNFTVQMVSLVDTKEAVIDPTANIVAVTVLASDDPYGLISFEPDSRNMAVDVSSRSVTLDVTRAQGTNGRVTVSYITTMLPERYTDNDLVINRAIENKDYITTQGMLVFETGRTSPDKEIVIELTPSSASDSPYPKAFNVTLFNITSGARLHADHSKTMVIISNKLETTQFLKLRSDSLKTPLSNNEMNNIIQSLFATISRETLTDSHISITVDILNTVLDDLGRRGEEKDRKLTDELSNNFMNVFDTLLNPERSDFKGKSQLTQPFVKYAFALLHGESCPGTTVVRKNGKYARVQARRRQHKDINNLKVTSSSSKNFFTYPSNIYQTTNSVGQSVKCGDIHFIEYLNTHWFNDDNSDDNILNDRVLSTSVKNSSETNPGQGPSFYRIYTGERRVTPKGAECLKWHKEKWDNSICTVKEDTDDYVECECEHFSNFAVRAQSDDRVGYEFYFYIAAFICMISFFLVIVAHHMCSLENTFSAKLLMHMFFAGFALHLLVIVAAYVSPDLTDKPQQCSVLGILIHYFLLAHFCWIFVQCCNLWRILVLNDEHTDRKFILYFMLGWGIPVLCIALYLIITHALYDWDITETYADVHSNGDMCFMPNAYGVLASVMAPILLFLLAVGVVTTQAYQVTLQWKLYDDIFRGRHNIKEVIHLWIIFFAITMTWLFGGLHLAFGKLWLAIFFAVFDVFTGLYVFMVYFVLRNQCRRKYRDEPYLLQASSPSLHNPSPTDYYAERPVMHDAQSVNSVPKSELRFSPPDGHEWDDFEYDGTTPKSSRRDFNDVPLAQLNPLYDSYHGKKPDDECDDDIMEKEEEELSVDLNDLVRALKTGETLPEEHDGKDDIVEMKREPARTDKLELRRVSIADTHV